MAAFSVEGKKAQKVGFQCEKVQVGQNIQNLVFRRKRQETIIKSYFRCFYCQLLHETNNDVIIGNHYGDNIGCFY